ncbi:MAG: hypothetical protein EPO55_24665 [Reyranella sp.]|uniref:S8 family serine peptidase n=1 Tax=Reyranella sp. TaxID=1929291 RepID=UPI00120F0557|nr:S8 family serine peptidase [Reyranella sp.]TAJ35661.1 MAG: hypothetical protein EPO55_24665 [Reyranella sp.]
MSEPKPSDQAKQMDVRDQIIVGFDEELGVLGLSDARKQIDIALGNLRRHSATVLRAFVSAGLKKESFVAFAVIRFDDPKVSLEYLNKVLKEDKKKTVAEKMLPGVVWFERNAPVTLDSFNDPYFRWQWALTKMEATSPWTIPDGPPAAPPALPDPPANPGKTLVAIIDSGLRLSDGTLHEDLGSVEPLVDCQPAGFFSDGIDTDGHGTMLAGTISTVYDNLKGLASAIPPDWHISLLPVKFFEGGGSPDVAGAAEAIMHAVDKGAKVINASWHVALGDGDKRILKDAIKYAKNATPPRLVVAAAGNDGSDNDIYPTYPANYGSELLFPGLRKTMLTVAATAPDDFKASFSNYGALGVDIAAPGTGIKTTGRYFPGLPGQTPQYPDYNGTSASAAFVSGAAALVFALNPRWTSKEVITHLKASADTIEGLKLVCIGGKRLNLRRAVYGPLRRITAPVANDTLQVGVDVDITWTNEYAQPDFNWVTIEFSKDLGNTWDPTPVKDRSANDGRFTWRPKLAHVGPNIVLKITPLMNDVDDPTLPKMKANFPVVSDVFRVVAPA